MNRWLAAAKSWAKALKRDVVALWIAARDPRTPGMAKLVSALVAAYALSPIDLIPDFIPVLGYLDDLLIVPLGILLAVRLIPASLIEEFRRLAVQRTSRPTSRAGLIAIVLIWACVTIGIVAWSVTQRTL
ncbi:YkvA family protein [Aureimonas sp. SA4125]|uniref:YkvA family protein n=1 Tax=Aureimonas sp. SA4125 TaxID=2826993 RepID=UPI001CC4A1AE|nr:YkvA family protein [Aureimonas sp. SA4125]